MIKYFCDKCGKELPLFNNTFISDMFKIEVEPPKILCYGCVRKFSKRLCEPPDSKYIAMKQEQGR